MTIRIKQKQDPIRPHPYQAYQHTCPVFFDSRMVDLPIISRDSNPYLAFLTNLLLSPSYIRYRTMFFPKVTQSRSKKLVETRGFLHPAGKAIR